jgi:pimeloyl-ACP methyl ester carboxylesterase
VYPQAPVPASRPESLRSAAELSALSDVAFEMADRIVTTTAQDVHRAIARRTFTAVGPASAVTQVTHDAVATGVYGAIRIASACVSALARTGAHAAANRSDALPISASPRGRMALSALNGLIGDELEEDGSDVRIELSLRHRGRDLPADPAALASAHPEATRRLVLFVHGLMENDESWRRDERAAGGTYGSRLRGDLGYTPLHLRYNTGLHISNNGRRLSELLETLVGAWPVPVSELVLVGHSMGGLVARSACAHAGEHEFSWIKALRHVVFLGSPHGGAPMEKAVNVAAWALAVAPESRPFANVLNDRSAGIKDLRFGYLREDDWREGDPDALLHNGRAHVPLTEGVEHHFVVATLSADPTHPVGYAVGDLLVRADSASGSGLVVATEDVRHLGRLNHFDLLNHPLVYEQIHRWLLPRSGEVFRVP